MQTLSSDSQRLLCIKQTLCTHSCIFCGDKDTPAINTYSMYMGRRAALGVECARFVPPPAKCNVKTWSLNLLVL